MIAGEVSIAADRSLADAVAASAALLVAVAAGDLTPSEATDIGKLADSYLRSIEAAEFEQRPAGSKRGMTIKDSFRRRLDRVEQRKRIVAKARPWITDGSSEEMASGGEITSSNERP